MHVESISTFIQIIFDNLRGEHFRALSLDGSLSKNNYLRFDQISMQLTFNKSQNSRANIFKLGTDFFSELSCLSKSHETTFPQLLPNRSDKFVMEMCYG